LEHLMPTMNASPNFAVNLRRLRHARGLSQLTLAVRAGLHPVSLSNAERGLRPRVETLERLARALEVTVTDLDADPPEVA
jgi:transcriptional regulator with XRE-family HTH domain